jgi:hypothetical protein
MHATIAEKRDEVGAICRRLNVRRLEVFGSAARGDDFELAKSDVDFLVEFDPNPDLGLFDTYFALRHALSNLLGREVDLVSARAVQNPYIRGSIEQNRELVHGE